MKKSKIIAFIAIEVLLVAVGGVMYMMMNREVDVIQNQEQDYHQITYNGVEYEYNSSIITVLLLGIDSEEKQIQGQSDAIELLIMDRENKKMKLLSFSRDIMTDIRLFDAQGNDLGWHEQHLNLAYAYGSNAETGCMYAMQAVSRLLNGVPIVHYASLNMNMLPDVQDLVGPIEVVVPNDSSTLIDPSWSKGNVITIDSSNVELFLRSRNTKENYSNEERMERQNAYMEAYQSALKNKINNDFDGMILNMYNIVQQATSNISLSDIETFANMVLEYDFNKDSDMIDIEGENVSGAYHDEYHVDKQALQELIIELFYKKK